MKKYYKISGLTVEMDSFGYTVTQAEPYLTEAVEKADIVIRSNWEKVKEKQPHLSDEDCEYMSTGASFYYQLLGFDGMLLHSSAVVMGGEAYLFSAPCGTGKSTHTALWRKVFGEDRAVILNDDKPAIRYVDGSLYAYGTPFSGKHDISSNTRAKVKGICFIERAKENRIEKIAPSKSIPLMLEQTLRSSDIGYMDKLLFVMDKLLNNVNVYKLYCNMDISAARLSYETMSNAEEPNA